MTSPNSDVVTYLAIIDTELLIKVFVGEAEALPTQCVPELVAEVVHEGCELVAIICTNMRGAAIVERLTPSKRTEVTEVSTSQATIVVSRSDFGCAPTTSSVPPPCLLMGCIRSQ